MSSPPNLQLVTGERMFQIAAIVDFISVFGHTKYGHDYFHKYLNVIPDKGDYVLARHGSKSSWNYINLTFFTAAALNWQWSYTNGPVSTAEEAIFWATAFFGIYGGFTFVRIGYYQPLIPLWIATVFQLLGYVMLARVGENASVLLRAYKAP